MNTLKEFDTLRDAGLTPEQARAIVYFVQRTAEASPAPGQVEPRQQGLPASVRWMPYALYGMALALIVTVSALLGR